MSTTYLNYLKHNIYFNAIDTEDQSNYIGMEYDITTELQAIKNYLGIDSTIQQNILSDYVDMTDYYLIIDES